MLKKLAFQTFLLVIISTTPSSAIIRGHYIDPADFPDGHPGDNILLKVDIDAQGNTGPNETQSGWTAWEADNYWGSFGPMTKDFGYGTGLPTVHIDGIQDGIGSNLGGSRDRTDTVGGYDNDFANMYADLVYVSTSGNMGQDYLKIDMLFGDDMANTKLQITLFDYELAFSGSGFMGFPGGDEPEDSKFVAWSTTNPADWLAANGYPDGYGFAATEGDSNMPAGLAALVEGLTFQHGTASWLSQYDDAYGMLYSTTVEVTLDEYGQVTLYGWSEMLSATGSSQAVLNGFIISLPEPATVALLSLGGLFVLKKRKI